MERFDIYSILSVMNSVACYNSYVKAWQNKADPGVARSGGARRGVARPGTWLGMAGLGLAWSGLARLGLAWLGKARTWHG